MTQHLQGEPVSVCFPEPGLGAAVKVWWSSLYLLPLVAVSQNILGLVLEGVPASAYAQSSRRNTGHCRRYCGCQQVTYSELPTVMYPVLLKTPFPLASRAASVCWLLFIASGAVGDTNASFGH